MHTLITHTYYANIHIHPHTRAHTKHKHTRIKHRNGADRTLGHDISKRFVTKFKLIVRGPILSGDKCFF